SARCYERNVDGATLRDNLNTIFAIVSTVLGVASVGYGAWLRRRKDDVTRRRRGPFIVGFWVIAPPIFFWCDWVFLAHDPATQEGIKVTYDLSRNIWVAFTVVLVALFGIKWPTSGSEDAK